MRGQSWELLKTYNDARQTHLVSEQLDQSSVEQDTSRDRVEDSRGDKRLGRTAVVRGSDTQTLQRTPKGSESENSTRNELLNERND